MDGLGLPYRAVASEFEETLDQTVTPWQLARLLAMGKAATVRARFPDAIVIGSDQVTVVDGVSWGKPYDEAGARSQLQQISGRTHEQVVAVAVLSPGLEQIEHEVARITTYALTPEEIEGYLATREWEGCAGSYRVEGQGLALFERIDGDLNTVRGLPTTLLVRMLRRAGVRFFGT
jgi:septum formation protein